MIIFITDNSLVILLLSSSRSSCLYSYTQNPEKHRKTRKMTNTNASSHTKSQNRKKRKITSSVEDTSVRQDQTRNNPERATGPLEGPSSSFGVRSTYHQTGLYVNLNDLESLGYDLREYLEPYMGWLSIKNDYNEEVLSSFYSFLEAKVYKFKISKIVSRIEFTTTIRGRKINFNYKTLNDIFGINPNSEQYKWKIHDLYSSEDEEAIYDSDNGRPSGMSAINRLLHFIFTRIMVHRPGNFGEFVANDNPWLLRLLEKKDINPGQLISIELHRYLLERKDKPKAKLPYAQLMSLLLENNNIKSTGVKNKCCKVLNSTHLKLMRNMPFIGKGTTSESTGRSLSQSHPPSIPAAAEEEVQSTRALRRDMSQGLADELILRLSEKMNSLIGEKIGQKLNILDARIKKLELNVSRMEHDLSQPSVICDDDKKGEKKYKKILPEADLKKFRLKRKPRASMDFAIRFLHQSSAPEPVIKTIPFKVPVTKQKNLSEEELVARRKEIAQGKQVWKYVKRLPEDKRRKDRPVVGSFGSIKFYEPIVSTRDKFFYSSSSSDSDIPNINPLSLKPKESEKNSLSSELTTPLPKPHKNSSP